MCLDAAAPARLYSGPTEGVALVAAAAGTRRHGASDSRALENAPQLGRRCHGPRAGVCARPSSSVRRRRRHGCGEAPQLGDEERGSVAVARELHSSSRSAGPRTPRGADPREGAMSKIFLSTFLVLQIAACQRGAEGRSGQAPAQGPAQAPAQGQPGQENYGVGGGPSGGVVNETPSGASAPGTTTTPSAPRTGTTSPESRPTSPGTGTPAGTRPSSSSTVPAPGDAGPRNE